MSHAQASAPVPALSHRPPRDSHRARRAAAALACAVAAGLAAGPATAWADTTSTTGATPSAAAAAPTALVRTVPIQYTSQAFGVLTKVNAQRTAAGLKPLTMDTKLMASAMTRAREVAITPSYKRPGGKAWSTALPKGYAKPWSESFAQAYSSAGSVVASWMKSAGNKANLLSKAFQSVGVGAVKVGKHWAWVMDFTAQPVAAGAAATAADYAAKLPVAPASMTLKKATSSKAKTVTATWASQELVTGYRVQAARDKKFTKGRVSKTVGSTTSVASLAKLKHGKTYYVRVEAYAKSGSHKAWSPWSKVKKVKVK
ncbi:MAG: CAP domain-containing protein [Bifidobacteriaceae bacterium]|jgi:uncharacterized protein YkwD|nr:CAP domain-containing protein [Bifidobacteriaceae bacterium]